MTALAVQQEAFDYRELAPADVATAQATAQWVRSTYRTLEETTLETMRDIGARLLQARETVGHGRFMAWVQAECGGISQKTAQRMMDIAGNLGPAEIRHVTNLPLKTVYALATMKAAPVRAEVVSRIEAGEKLSPQDIDNHLAAAREKARRAKMPSPDERMKEAARERRRELDSYRDDQQRVANEAQRLQRADEFVARLLAWVPEHELEAFKTLRAWELPFNRALEFAINPSRRDEHEFHLRRRADEARARHERRIAELDQALGKGARDNQPRARKGRNG